MALIDEMENETTDAISLADLTDYVNAEYEGKLKRPVTLTILRRWYKAGKLTELSEAGIEDAFKSGKIPPKRGKPVRDGLDKTTILEVYHASGDNQNKTARTLKCDPAWVHRVVRGKV